MIETVLCIDDDLTSLVAYEAAIKKANFAKEIITATNGREALTWFSEYFSKQKTGINTQASPSLIFLDLEMPRMDGWQFIDEFMMKYADRLPETKIVIVTSSINPEHFSRKENYEVVLDFIHKPFTAKHLEELMETSA